MSLFAVSIFLSAFLLFQIQPMIGKLILPWFGGTPAVWSTVMLFFQVLLTGGYAYAYWLIERVETKRQMKSSHFVDHVSCSASHLAFDHLGFAHYPRLRLEASKCQYTDPRYFQTACCFRGSALFHSCGERSPYAGLVQPPFS